MALCDWHNSTPENFASVKAWLEKLSQSCLETGQGLDLPEVRDSRERGSIAGIDLHNRHRRTEPGMPSRYGAPRGQGSFANVLECSGPTCRRLSTTSAHLPPGALHSKKRGTAY